ncbi:MAG: hypothetical protein Q9193_002678 [Seirophora villosa]
MTTLKLAAVVAALTSSAAVSAHGIVTSVIAGGQKYPGYELSYAYAPSHPPVVGWSTPGNKDTGFVNPGNFSRPNIVCHNDATPAELYVPVAAGGTVELQWSGWPESHHGPVIDYLANCNGECTSADKTKLKFNKIDELGLISWESQPGKWATDKLIAAGNKWTVTVPKNVAPGNYVLRHEMIALHASEKPDGAQNYPQCVNLKVTGSGTDKLASGTLATELYTPEDPGILVNIYKKLTSYTIPGPKLYSGASTGSGSASSGVTTSTSGGYEAVPTGEASSTAAVTPTTITMSTGGGYGAIPTGEGSSTAVVAPTTAAPLPTGIYTNSTSVMPHKPGKSSKKPCKSTGSGLKTSTTATATPITSAAVGPTTTPSVEPTLPSTVPTAPVESTGATPSSGYGDDDAGVEPKQKLPKDMTLKELFEWLDLIVAELKKQMGGKTRRHARAFMGL